MNKAGEQKSVLYSTVPPLSAAADPYEARNLAEVLGYEDKVLEMKQKILHIIETDYLKPQDLVTVDWYSEAVKVIGPEDAWSTGTVQHSM